MPVAPMRGARRCAPKAPIATAISPLSPASASHRPIRPASIAAGPWPISPRFSTLSDAALATAPVRDEEALVDARPKPWHDGGVGAVAKDVMPGLGPGIHEFADTARASPSSHQRRSPAS